MAEPGPAASPSDRPSPGADGADRGDAAAEAARRARLREVFGDVLPEQTADDVDPDDHGDRGGSTHDAWLRRQVPPHHGG